MTKQAAKTISQIATLDSLLLKIGGTNVEHSLDDSRVTSLLIDSGRLLQVPVKQRSKRAALTNPHTATATVWGKATEKYDVATGYGLFNTVWRQHSWLMDKTAPTIWETIEVADKYFGVVLAPGDAAQFWFDHYLAERYPGPSELITLDKVRPVRVIQFDWKKNWKTRVSPFLNHKTVQYALDEGMKWFNPEWKKGDAPYLQGRVHMDVSYIRKGSLDWYRPLGCCFHIALFSMAIGVLNYPDLEWRFVTGGGHTVPAGYDADGRPVIVMDILNYKLQTAEESLAASQGPDLIPSPNDKEAYEVFQRRLETDQNFKHLVEWERDKRQRYSFFLKWSVPRLQAVARGHDR